MKDEYTVGLAGATRAVGNDMGKILKEQNFPLVSLKRLASSRSVEQTPEFLGGSLAIEERCEDSF